MDNIYEKDLYVNPNIFYIFNTKIIEYDMKDAGLSLSKDFKLLTKSQLNKLEKMEKKKRTIELGLIQQQDEVFKENLKQAFVHARKLFFEYNNLDKSDIVSIKKDAIFSLKKCNYEELGDYIRFRPKNEYTSYIRLNSKIELYYSPDKLDVKGISDSKLPLHEDYILSLIKNFFKRMECDDKAKVINYMRKIIDKYKAKELELGYYREFNNFSKYDLIDESDNIISPSDLSNIDISYNFYNVLIKLIKIPL